MAMVSLQGCYDRAHGYMTAGEYGKAEAICQHILQYYPQDLGTFQLLGQINLERKRAAKARQFFQQVLEIDPENVSAHWGMGIAYQDEGNLENAIREFEQALEIKPDLSDLRSQLLRLYTELYGTSRAQLRLNRAGLGRLYVKGEMLDKAVEEFREVLKADPSRVDVQLSLIGALWQAGEVEESAKVCEEILQQFPNALKANLILGYARMKADRREEAEELWRRAAACDPNNTLARAIFEMAPVRVSQTFLAYDSATLPDFDEEQWEAMREAAAAEVPVPEGTAVALEDVPVDEPAEVEPADSEQLGVSWLDDLATGEGQVGGQAAELVPGVSPFDLEGLENLEELAAPVPDEVREETLPEGIFPAPEPVAGGPSEAPVAPPEPAAVEREDEFQPFSLEDLGLSGTEMADLEGAIAAAREEGLIAEEPTAVPAFTEDVAPTGEELIPGVAPFSLEQTVSPDAGEGLPAPAAETLSAAEVEELGEGLAVEGFPEELQPFSLEEFGLDEPAIALEERALEESLEGIAEGEGAGVPAFSWQEPLMPDEPTFVDDLSGEQEEPGGPSIFQKLVARRREVGPEERETAAAAEGGPGEGLGVEGVEPFSLQEMGLEEAPVAEAAPEGGLELADVQPFSLEGMGLEETLVMEEAAPEEASGDVEFSLEQLGLEEVPVSEEQVPEQEPLPAMLEGDAAAPFSLEALGLEEPLVPVEEEAPVAEEELAPVEAALFSLEELGLEDVPEAAAAVEEVVAEGPASMDETLQPFTLEELGLTPEEVVGLGLGEEELLQVDTAEEEAAVAVEEVLVEGEATVEAALAAEEIPAEEQVEPVEEELVAAVAAEEEAPSLPEEETPPVVEAVLSLDELRQQVEANADDAGLRLQFARACVEQKQPDEAARQYKVLIKAGKAELVEEIIADVQAWIDGEEGPDRLQRLHRLLGDAYMKKGWYQQAITEYAWVLGKPQ